MGKRGSILECLDEMIKEGYEFRAEDKADGIPIDQRIPSVQGLAFLIQTRARLAEKERIRWRE